MAWAGIALTRPGADLLRRLRDAGLDPEVYLPRRWVGLVPGAQAFDPPLRHLAERLWHDGRGLLWVAPTGVVVRVIAPLLRDTARDPAVVVADESGHYVVPLVGAHRSGGEALARRVAAALGGVPVLTTASAVHGIPALDLLGVIEGWALVEGSGMMACSAALANGEPVALYQDAGDDAWAHGLSSIVRLPRPDLADPRFHRALVVVSQRELPLPRSLPLVVYCPRTLALAIGCQRGTEASVVRGAVDWALSRLARRREAVAVVATARVKQDEPAIWEVAQDLGVPLRTFPTEELARSAQRCPSSSEVVARAIGAPGVAEPSALLASDGGRLVLPEQRYRERGRYGAVTVAVSELSSPLRPRGGTVLLVGTGPGSPAQMTEAAQAALRSADVVVGYHRYIDGVRPLLGPHPSSRLGAEDARADLSLAFARRGARLALLSGGDPGIYGMASRVLSRLRPEDPVAVETYPGVTALVAAAARVGAPLGDDFAAVSLSDLHTPRALIRRRLRAAVAGEFVVALYNPRSLHRTGPFQEALQILRRHRPSSTPVAVVRAAFREGEWVRLTDLGSLDPEEVDMQTLVLVGNRWSRFHLGRFVTGRREGR